MLVSPLNNEPSVAVPSAAEDAPLRKRSQHMSGDVRAPGSPDPRRTRSNPLLNLPIGRRLALGFLIPALIAALTLSSVGVQSQQRLLQESTLYQHLFDAYTSLTMGGNLLQQMHTDVQKTVIYAAQPHPLTEVLTDNQRVVQGLAVRFNTVLAVYLQQDLLAPSPDLVALFTEAGHAAQIEEQQTYSEGARATWQAYRAIQEQLFGLISTGSLARAQVLLVTQENTAFTDAGRELQALITFNETLLPSLHDAATVEVQKLLIGTLLAVLGVLLGIGIVGWLVSSTLVRRLKGLRSVVQSIEKGQLNARLAVVGRDEIAAVSTGVNAMLDTIIDAQVLEKLHQELQSQHEALNTAHAHLNEANARLEALATTDALTELPNHRSLVSTLDQELERAQSYQRSCSILFLDIDHFKALNDGYGHASGDTVLHEFAGLIRTRLRLIDTAGRWGGEEFVAILPEMTIGEAQVFAEEMRVGVAAHLFSVGGGSRLTCSIGVACYPTHACTREDLMNAADQAMYAAKRLGRDQVRRVDDPLVQALLLENNEDGGREESALAGIVAALTRLVEAHDPSIGQHSLAVSELLPGLMQNLGLPAAEAQMIVLAGRLHDIGKISLPASILYNPGRLTEEEWAMVRTHPATGAEVVSSVPVLRPLAPVIRAHHERWDGQGYPDQLAGKAIPFGARVIAVVNAYMAMTAERPYQKARSQALALAELKRCAGTQFDPQVVDAMERLLLSDQLMAEIAGMGIA